MKGLGVAGLPESYPEEEFWADFCPGADRLPPKSLQGDSELVLQGGCTIGSPRPTFRADAQLLRDASTKLELLLDSCTMEGSALDKGLGSEHPRWRLDLQRLEPSCFISESGMIAFLQALYCRDDRERMNWALQQPLGVLQDLADASYALDCGFVLLVDKVLADRAVTELPNEDQMRRPSHMACQLSSPLQGSPMC